LERNAHNKDCNYFVVIEKEAGRMLGTLCLMRADLANGTIEVGNVVFFAPMRRTTLATEAHFLLMKYVFEELKYRRYEWKCDNLNAPSKAAASRLGFQHEGLFRQAVVYKGRSRDTAWFSITDSEWPRLNRALARWLSPANFKDGKQVVTLTHCLNEERHR
jgi:RimJ/RimL family protein N-acetyltransferase